MANILYGINGEGSGHWSRSKEVIDHLKGAGHNVYIVTSGRATQNLSKFYPTEEIYGFRFVYTNGKLNEFASSIKNLGFVPKVLMSLKKIIGLFKKLNIDLVITDFEPISCLAANIKRIPIISIDNQHFATNTKAFKPKDFLLEDFPKSIILMKAVIPGAKAYLTTSFFEAEPDSNKTVVVPPIVRKEFFDLKPSYGDYLIVYFVHSLGKIGEVLKSVNYKFIFYGAKEAGQDGNVTYKKFDQIEFLKDLAGAGGVLSTAGFSLISESLYLKKPILAWPTERQYEQIFNAYHIERLGYGKSVKNLTKEKIESFISSLDSYKQKLAPYPYKDNQKLFNTLDELIQKLAPTSP